MKKITFNLIVIKEITFIKKNISTILLKNNFWDNFINKKVFGQLLLKTVFLNFIKNNFLDFPKNTFLNFIKKTYFY